MDERAEETIAPNLLQVPIGRNRQERRAIERHPERYVEPIKRGGVVVAYPTGGQPLNGFVQSLIGVINQDIGSGRGIIFGQRGGGVFSVEGGPRVAETRTQMVLTFLQEPRYAGADWLLTVDDDMTFQPDLVERLVDAATEADADVMGALAFAGGRSVMFPTVYALERDEDGQLGTRPVEDYPRDSLVKVGATGTGCMLIRRSILVRLLADYPVGYGTMPDGKTNFYPWFVEGHTFGGGKPLGEDIAFCIRVNAIGGSIYVDTSIKVGHLKTYEMNEALWDQLRGSEPIPAEAAGEQDDGVDGPDQQVSEAAG